MCSGCYRDLYRYCSFCFSVVDQILSHECTLTTRLENLTKIIEESGPKVEEQVASSLIKRKFGEEKENTATISLTQPRGGQPLKITVNKNVKGNSLKQTLLTADDFLKIENNFHLSQNKIMGIAGAIRVAAKNPCTWCYAMKGKLDERGAYRTSGNTIQNYERWCTAASLKNAKNYYNCIHPPLFTSKEDKTFLQIIPPPELHLILGVVNTIFKHLLAEFEDDATR